jgi:hypothetical protein
VDAADHPDVYAGAVHEGSGGRTSLRMHVGHLIKHLCVGRWDRDAFAETSLLEAGPWHALLHRDACTTPQLELHRNYPGRDTPGQPVYRTDPNVLRSLMFAHPRFEYLA